MTTLKDSIPPSTSEEISKFQNVFVASMSDDFHTLIVLATLSDPLKTINDLLHTRKVFVHGREIAILSSISLGIQESTFSF